MNFRKIITKMTFILAFGFIFSNANAQRFKVETVKMLLMDNSVDDTEKDLEKALELINEASTHSSAPTDPKFHYFKGLLHLKIAARPATDPIRDKVSDPIQVAYESFNKVIEVDNRKKFTKDAEANMLNVAIGMFNKGQNAYTDENFDEAITSFDIAVDLLKYDKDGILKTNNLTKEVISLMIGYSHLAKKDLPKASKTFQELIDADFRDVSIYTNLTLIQLEMQDTNAALKTISRGKEIFDTDKNLINLELDLYIKLGRSEELIEKLNQAVESDPYNATYLFARAVTHEGMKNYDKAEEDYNKAIEADNSYFDAYYNLGVMFTNRAAEVIEEMNAKTDLKAAEYQAYEEKTEALYKKSLSYFEVVFNENTEMKIDDKIALADVMRKLYAQISDMEKYNEMKRFIEES